jgi:hypothetical protein
VLSKISAAAIDPRIHQIVFELAAGAESVSVLGSELNQVSILARVTALGSVVVGSNVFAWLGSSAPAGGNGAAACGMDAAIAEAEDWNVCHSGSQGQMNPNPDCRCPYIFKPSYFQYFQSNVNLSADS